MKRTVYAVVALLVISVNAGCDQGTKHFAREKFRNSGTIEVVDRFIIIHYIENDGAFLSLGSGLKQPVKTVFLLIVPLLVMAASVLYVFISRELSIAELVCICSIIGGGVSNIYDRLMHNGWVTDFMNFGIGGFRTGTMNFADLSICAGAFFLIIIQYMKEKKIKPA